MKRLPRVRQVLVAAGIGSLILASTVAASAGTATAKLNAADAKLVPSALEGKTLQVATDATYAPDESMSGTTMVGFDVDLMGAIATTLGFKIKENNVEFDSILAGIKGGRYEIGNSSFTDEKSREKQVNFVDYFQAGEGVYTVKSSKAVFKGFSSFCGMTVAVETGTVEQSDAKAESKKCSSSKKVTVVGYPNQNDANAAVLSGHATVGFVDSQIAGYIVSSTGGKFKLLGSAVNVAPYGIATPKTTQGESLAVAIQAAIKTLIKSGVYGSILSKWGVSAGALPAGKIVLNGATS